MTFKNWLVFLYFGWVSCWFSLSRMFSAVVRIEILHDVPVQISPGICDLSIPFWTTHRTFSWLKVEQLKTGPFFSPCSGHLQGFQHRLTALRNVTRRRSSAWPLQSEQFMAQVGRLSPERISKPDSIVATIYPSNLKSVYNHKWYLVYNVGCRYIFFFVDGYGPYLGHFGVKCWNHACEASKYPRSAQGFSVTPRLLTNFINTICRHYQNIRRGQLSWHCCLQLLLETEEDWSSS